MIYTVESGGQTRKVEANSAVEAAGMFALSFLGMLVEITDGDLDQEHYVLASTALSSGAKIARACEKTEARE